jgi:hypothetical protein
MEKILQQEQTALQDPAGHPSSLDYYANIQVMYLPPKTTSLLQPMDQRVIVTFKRYYLQSTWMDCEGHTAG